MALAELSAVLTVEEFNSRNGLIEGNVNESLLRVFGEFKSVPLQHYPIHPRALMIAITSITPVSSSVQARLVLDDVEQDFALDPVTEFYPPEEKSCNPRDLLSLNPKPFVRIHCFETRKLSPTLDPSSLVVVTGYNVLMMNGNGLYWRFA